MTRTSTRLRGAALLAATLSVLSLSGCSEIPAGTAAVVNGKRILIEDVQLGTLDLQRYVGPPNGITQIDVLQQLILEPVVMGVAQRNKQSIPRDDVVKEFAAKGVRNPADGAVRAVWTSSTLNRLANEDPARRQQVIGDIVNRLKTAKIEVNPRYGTFDPNRGTVSAITWNWTEPLSAVDANPAPDAGQAPDVGPAPETDPSSAPETDPSSAPDAGPSPSPDAER